MINWVKRLPVLSNLPALHRTNVGKLGESIAASYLTRKRFRIIERNFKARYGEIDIIAIDQDTLVFVEVKTRISSSFGTPEEAVTPRKLREVVKTAEYYASLHPTLPKLLRIDAIGIMLDPTTMSHVALQHTANVTG